MLVHRLTSFIVLQTSTCLQSKSNMLMIQVRQQNDTLLFVWISPRDEGDATFRVAHIVGQMGHIGWDVKKVASFSDEMLFESFAVPHP